MSEESDRQSARRERAVRAKELAKNKAHAVKRKAAQKPKQEASGFMNFVKQQGVVGLAVGLVLGTQIKALVDQLIASFINPVLGLVLPGKGGLSEKVFTWSVPALDKQAQFSYGAFIYVLISFLTVALIIYYIVKTLRLDKLNKQA